MDASSAATSGDDVAADQGLPPWQFFLLCGMLGATAVVIVATGQSIANILILSATVVATSFVALGVYRTFAPLVSHTFSAAPTVAGGRTRAALEREKTLVLRAIKELEFDFAMGKLSQADFDEMAGRLRRRAMGLMQQLDATTGYREQIEREVTSLAAVPAPSAPADVAARTRTCPGCDTRNDIDARFCKQCGTSLSS
ncbi:MAG: zinc ribbon domain-containing protein [Acidobacteria bacterium]|nr:zinc ribbon domain-containing protein [Acidobacteriota bacterium]